jgi:TetR/AcrR family acrAB operon transcriptional repressor
MVKRTKEEALETRNQLLDAAENVFHRDGYARTTFDAIAEEARLTRGAIYWHFRNKSDLFNTLCERVRLPMEELIIAGVDPVDPLGHLRRECTSFLKQTAENPHTRKVLDVLFHKCEFVDPADPVYVRHQEAFLRGRKLISDFLAAAVNKGQLPSNLNIPLATTMFQASVDGILKNWLFLPDCFDLAATAEQLVDASLDTVRHAPALRKARPA